VLRLGVTIKIGVILPTSTPDPTKPILGDVRASARLAGEAGLDSVWSTDHLVASAPILDSTVVLATAAAVTDRITIGFGVMPLALRPVAWAAKQIATLQQVSALVTGKAAYEAAGTERVILVPSESGWQRDYEFAADLRAAL
jgi:Luciferase-like monooxygenase